MFILNLYFIQINIFDYFNSYGNVINNTASIQTQGMVKLQ